jgi:Bacterial Ig-like domain (group 2)
VISRRPIPASGVSVWLLLLASSCGDSTAPQLGSPALVIVAPSTISVAAGEQRQLTAEVRDASGGVIADAAVTWTSTNPAAAAVDGSGRVSGVAVGTAEIIASADGVASAQARVGVYSARQKGRLDGVVSGVALFEDPEFDMSGLTGVTRETPIPFAAVEVVRLFDFSTVGQGTTRADGSFAVPVSNPGPAGVYVRVLTRGESAQVFNSPRDLAAYAVVSDGIDDSGEAAPVTLVASQETLAGRAFNVYAALVTGAETVRRQAADLPPTAIAYWQPGRAGTFYEDVEGRIYVSGSSIDPDEHDDAVILHEYGHLVAHHLARDDSPGGRHGLFDNAQDIRLAWSEGWADFFGSAARANSLYVDTDGAGRSRLAFDLESLASPVLPTLAEHALYTTSEVAVGAVLWDLYDASGDEAFDAVAVPFPTLWQVLRDFASPASLGRTTSFELFWDTLRRQNPSLPEGDLAAIARERAIELAADAYEPDDEAPGELAPGLPRRHTLLGEDDVDRFTLALPAGDWLVETRNLSGGADTLLEVTDGAGNPVAANDNRNGRLYSQQCGVMAFTQTSSCPRNDATTLSSAVSFSVPGGAYGARVRRSPAAPPSAGLYGTYEILLQRQ